MPLLQIARPVLIGVLLVWAAAGQVNVLTANYGNDRTNTTLQEQILNTSKVTPTDFGRIGSFPVDGQIYAQSLYVQGLTIGGQTRNVVFVATLRNTVYAIDADAPTSTVPLWSVNLGPPVPSTFLEFNDIRPEVGILGTPVIDLARNVIYVVTDTFESVAVGAARQAAWALTGTLPDWPVPVISQQEPTATDQRASVEIMERYRSVLAAHFGV